MEVKIGVLDNRMKNMEDAVKEMGTDIKTILHRLDTMPLDLITRKEFEDYKADIEISLTKHSWIQNTLSAAVGAGASLILGVLILIIYHDMMHK